MNYSWWKQQQLFDYRSNNTERGQLVERETAHLRVRGEQRFERQLLQRLHRDEEGDEATSRYTSLAVLLRLQHDHLAVVGNVEGGDVVRVDQLPLHSDRRAAPDEVFLKVPAAEQLSGQGHLPMLEQRVDPTSEADLRYPRGPLKSERLAVRSIVPLVPFEREVVGAGIHARLDAFPHAISVDRHPCDHRMDGLLPSLEEVDVRPVRPGHRVKVEEAGQGEPPLHRRTGQSVENEDVDAKGRVGDRWTADHEHLGTAQTAREEAARLGDEEVRSQAVHSSLPMVDRRRVEARAVLPVR